MTFVPRKMLREESRTLKTGHNKSCGFTNETTAQSVEKPLSLSKMGLRGVAPNRV